MQNVVLHICDTYLHKGFCNISFRQGGPRGTVQKPTARNVTVLRHLTLKCLNFIGDTVSKAARPYSYKFEIFVLFVSFFISFYFQNCQILKRVSIVDLIIFFTSVSNMFYFSIKYKSLSCYIFAVKILLSCECSLLMLHNVKQLPEYAYHLKYTLPLQSVVECLP